jgi:Protein of unknown function (DUF1559)
MDKLLTAVFTIVVIVPCFYFLAIPVCNIRDVAQQVKSANNLKQIGLAIYRFEDANDELPTNTFTPDGTPLLSWRVHILPYLDHDDLYRQFKLDEPWDSPHNIRLLDKMPPVYVNPKARDIPANKTVYRGFSSPGAVFERRPTRNPAAPLPGGGVIDVKTRFRLANFKDPLTETILVVEAAEPVEWTKPDDLNASPGNPLPPLLDKPFSPRVLLADGSVRTLLPKEVETNFAALVTHSGGEKLPPR